MLKLFSYAATAAVLCLSTGIASASTIATIDANGIAFINDGENEPLAVAQFDNDLNGLGGPGVVLASDVTGVNNGLSLGSLESYTYTASLWICEEPVGGGDDEFSGCNRNDDPVLAGAVPGSDLLDFLMESPDGGDTYGEILIGIIEDLFDNDGVAEILDSGLFLGVSVEEFEIGSGGDTFEAFLVKYLGFDAECAFIIAEGGIDCAGFDIEEGDVDLAYSLVLTIEDGASVIPLPASFPLILAGIGAIGFAGRRKKK